MRNCTHYAYLGLIFKIDEPLHIAVYKFPSISIVRPIGATVCCSFFEKNVYTLSLLQPSIIFIDLNNNHLQQLLLN